MNNNEGTSWWAMGLDNSKFQSDVQKANAMFHSIGDTADAEGKRIDAIFSRVTTAAVGFFTLQQAQSFAMQVANVRGEFQKLEVAFNTMLGSKEKADALMSQLIRTAAITPFDLQGVASGAKQLLAYGEAADKVNDTLVRLGNIAAGLSIPLNDIVYLYGTTMVQGRLYAQDVRQFTGRGIPLVRELAAMYGVTADQINDMVSAGKIGFPEVEKVLKKLTDQGGQFYNLMEEQSKTITGQISNIEDAISTMFNEIGKQNEGIINDALATTSFLVENWKQVAVAIESAVIAYGTYKAATMTVAAYQGAAETLRVQTEIDGLKQLIVLKQEEKNQDLASAVASGRLSQAKATELAQLREELASRLAVLNEKKAEAIQNEAMALSALKEAQAEWVATGSIKSNTAETRLNTAQKAYNEAVTQRKAAAEAADTLAMNINTVSTQANAAATNVLKGAVVQLTGILKSLYATLMANPLAIVTAAVLGVGYAIYKLATMESDADRIARKHSEAIEEQEKKLADLQKKNDDLKAAVEDETKGEYDRLKAFEALKAEYPTILDHMLTEAEYLKDIAKYKKLIAQEDEKRSKEADIELLEQARAELRRLTGLRMQHYHVSNEAIQAQEKVVNDQRIRVAEHDVKTFVEGINEMKSEDIASVIADIESEINSLGESADDTIVRIASIGGEFSKSQIKLIQSKLQAENDARNVERKTAQDWLAELKANYEKAEKALKDYESKKDEITKEEYDKEYKRLSDELDAAKKAYQEKGGSVTKKTVNDASITNQIREQQERISLLEKEQAEERKRITEDLELEIAQQRIDLLADGAEKAQRQRELDNKKELINIQRQKDAYIKQYIQAQKEIFDAKEDLKAKQDKNYRKKTFSSEGVTVNTSQYDTLMDNTSKLQLDNRIKEQEEAWNNYLIQFGNYQQKRKAIIEKYDKEIASALTAGDEAVALKNKEKELESLDEQYGQSTRAMADLFESASEKTVSEIQKIIDKYELLVQYLSGSESGISVDDLKALGFREKDLESIVNGTYNLKDLTDALKNLKGELKGKSPWQTFFNDIGKGIDKLKNANGDINAFGTGLRLIGNAVGDFAEPVKQFSSDIATIFGFDDSDINSAIDALGGLGNAVAGVGQIFEGDIVGGIMNAASGLASVFSSIGGWLGLTSDFSHYNAMKEQYETLNEVWDELIAKKQEYISISYGEEARKAGEEAEKITKKSIESWRLLAKERLNAGAALFSHSIGYKTVDDMSKEGWAELRKAASNIGFSFDTQANKRMMWLFDLTNDQLEKLKDEAPTFWAKLDEDVRGYLDNIIEGEERIESIQESVREQLTQVSFDSVYESFTDLIANLDSKAEDFGENFEGYLQKAILSTMVGEKYKAKLRAWYEAFAQANDDAAGITKDELDRSQAEWNAIVQDALTERDRLKSIFGWKGSEDEERKGASKGINAVNQETASEISGRATAIQGHTYEIKESVKSIVEDMRRAIDLLTAIRDNTEYCSHLDTINSNIKHLREGIESINNKGVKIKA